MSSSIMLATLTEAIHAINGPLESAYCCQKSQLAQATMVNVQLVYK